MVEVRGTPQASDGLEAITRFIAVDSPHYARLFAIDVLASVERLVTFPHSGRMVPELNDPAASRTAAKGLAALPISPSEGR